MVHISAGEVAPKKEESKLKRVLSVWGLKKGKDKDKDREKERERERGREGEADWMGRVEREGVRRGVLVGGEAGAPVVRY